MSPTENNSQNSKLNPSDSQIKIAMLICQKFETSSSTYFYFFGAKIQDSSVAALSPPTRKI